MELRPGEDGQKLAWDLQEESMVNIIAEARRICEEHNRNFTARDVLVWDNQENIKARQKAEAEAEARRQAEEEKAAEIVLRAQAKREAEVEKAAEKLLAKREAETKKLRKEKTA